MHKTIESSMSRLEIIRKEIHQHPEVAEREYETAKRIIHYLNTHCNGEVHSVANTGVLVSFESKKPGPTVLLRADTDALPIVEVNEFSYKSIVPGVSHKCGHDGHTTIMLGVAELLSSQPPTQGTVLLLFQPAEENGMGAEAVLKSDYFHDLHIDFVFALHNLPGFKKNMIVLKENTFNANVKSMIIHLNGKTAHAAEPELGVNPALAIGDILQFSEKITNNRPERDDFFLVTPVHMTMGEIAYGISAGHGEVHLTIRSWNLNLFNERCQLLESFIITTCENYGLQHTISWTQEFYANQNDNEAVAVIRKAALTNEFAVHEMQHPFKWGEDFGLFTQRFKGAMFGLGAGENTPALHNPDYDFPDDITATGIQQFFQIIQEINHS